MNPPLFGVLDWVAVSWAVASGVVLGSTLITWLTLRYPAARPTTSRRAALVIAASALIVGTTFYAGQIGQSVASHDPLWFRVFGRYILWDIFSVSLGVGFGFARSFASTRGGP